MQSITTRPPSPLSKAGWRLPQLLLLLALLSLVAFMVLDRTVLHVYSPDVAVLKADIKTAQDTESRDYLDMQGRVNSVDKNVQNALNTQPTPATESFDQYLRDNRMASSLAVLSLLQAYGGTQSANSSGGKACVAYFMSGAGSFTDCGFQHVGP